MREDLVILRGLVGQLQQDVRDLAKEQREASSQSTENFGHDDACQEAIYDKRRLVLSRLNSLVPILNSAVIVEPEEQPTKVQFGTVVELSDGRRIRIGSYAIYARHSVYTISYNSPLGKSLIGKQEGDTTFFRSQEFVITKISGLI
ncbi:MAG: hypothetical protein COV33_01700 [Candidatus Zambryskibacteria bacterium CG10_big_fil_rev_8_21_14_0_10_34_34]|uniref:Transcription elongation factor GreA/GreB C-terminal domain-containing protein n=1 Tax=Candidatus Zambryskibacteria bacterium CG10_big_fil_rev_8_21_14_0_10_34_34 TaxID=1975114 RepID=A0A2H0R0K0_9BACT|nr:MAG: hypothetical protein COV33_01700 [Candidatus Zambryskibacteria bacterium CG10_big_fil_rev_8_21_14_0_10_34_34]